MTPSQQRDKKQWRQTVWLDSFVFLLTPPCLAGPAGLDGGHAHRAHDGAP